jgi:DNA ligase (NAD+)
MLYRGRKYEKIGAPPVEKIRTKLPYFMASLNKVKPGTRALLDFLDVASSATPKTPLVVSLKLDGVSGMISYRKGVPTDAYTRGDGTWGGNVSYLIDYVKLPKKLSTYPNMVVRGEFIVSKRVWEETFSSSGYSNARSLVSAKINSGYVSFGLGEISFVAYEIITLGSDADLPTPSESLAILEAEGFLVPYRVILTDPTVFELCDEYRRKRDSSDYNIDGLVLTRNLTPPPKAEVAKNPTNSVAFKMRLEDQVRNSKILTVEWNVSRHGKLVPVAVYESVYVDGVRMHRASLFNAARVRDWRVGKGTKIKVVRSGDVIPTIIDAVPDPLVEPIFPPQTAPYGKWHWKGSDLWLDDIEGNRQVQIKRMEHFFSIVEVPGLREGNLANLWDAGYRSVSAITNLTAAGFVRNGSTKVKGIGAAKSKAFYESIRTCLRRTRLSRYLEASTALQGVGRKIIRTVLLNHPDMLKENVTPDQIRKLLKTNPVPGVGKVRIETFATGIPKFRTFLNGLNAADVKIAIKAEVESNARLAKEGYNPKINGKTFVMTGFYGKTDYELEDYVYDHGGDLSSTISSSVAAVISSNLLDVTDKMLAAQALKVPVLSMEEFVKRFNVPHSKFLRSDENDEGEASELGIEDL